MYHYVRYSVLNIIEWSSSVYPYTVIIIPAYTNYTWVYMQVEACRYDHDAVGTSSIYVHANGMLVKSNSYTIGSDLF